MAKEKLETISKALQASNAALDNPIILLTRDEIEKMECNCHLTAFIDLNQHEKMQNKCLRCQLLKRFEKNP